MADYDWFDDTPSEADKLAAKWRAQGLHPIITEHGIGGRAIWIDHYKCRRGCGCLVWDPDAHVKNVCTTFKPVIGDGLQADTS